LPYGCSQVGAAYDVVTITNEVLQKVEYLRLKRDEIGAAP
jgi:hypothetical protein